MTTLVTHRYLNLPVRNGAPKRRLRLAVGEELFDEGEIELASAEPDFWVFLDLAGQGGKSLAVTVDGQDAASALVGAVQSNTIAIVTFATGVVGLNETSWVQQGGMQDRAEIYGTKVVTYADLLLGSSLVTYSAGGYGYAVEKASNTQGWTFTMYDELWHYGFLQELAHFVDCVAHDRQPKETGEDGRAVLEMIYAGYESARTGQAVALPFYRKVERPVDLWRS